MKDFKLKPGVSKVFAINQEVYREETSLSKPYVRKGKDGIIRYFAVCPACNNPIQMVNLFKENSYGKHYCRSVAGVTAHNEKTYTWCPNASRNYKSLDKNERKKELTELERSVYSTVREHFDQAVYVLRQDTGLYISDNTLKEMLEHYCETEGWRYPWAFEYNIPWMLMYVYKGIPIYGKRVYKDSKLYAFLSKNTKYKLLPNGDGFCKVLTTEWVNASIMLSKHRRRIEGDALKETVELVYSEEKDGIWEIKWRTDIEYGEKRFLNLITSKDAEKYRNRKLIKTAENIMPEI